MNRLISIFAALTLLISCLPLFSVHASAAPDEAAPAVSFVFGEARRTRTYAKGEVPLCTLCFDEGPFDGTYRLFAGFDAGIAPVAGDAVYTAQISEAKTEDVLFFSLSYAGAPAGGEALLSLYAGCAFDALSLRLLYDDAVLTFVGLESAIDGLTAKDGALTYSGAARAAGKIAELRFRVGENGGTRVFVDLLPDVYLEGARLPVAVNAGAVLRAEKNAGDLDGSGRLDEGDRSALLDGLSKGGGVDLDGDGVCGVKDLSALICSSLGVPVPLYDGSYKAESTLSYTAGIGGKLTGEATRTAPFAKRADAAAAAPIDEFYRFCGWSDGWPSLERSDPGLGADASYEALFELYTPEYVIPQMSIRTAGRQEIRSKTNYIGATCTITGAEEGYNFESLTAQIRGRGNSSWDAYRHFKPSYKLLLDQKQALIPGKGKEKDWILLTTMSDKSMLRNWATLHLGELFDGIGFSSGCRFVEVTLNGTYLGLYLLCEQVEISPARIAIDDNVEGADKDLLFALNARAEEPKFTISGGQQPYEFKSTVSSDDLREIRRDVTRADKAIKAGDRAGVEKYIDLASFVDMFILEELSNDRDVSFASFYILRKDGIYYLTAPWDFDLAWGNDSEYPNYDVLMTDINGNYWFKALWKQAWFKELVEERAKELWNTVEAVRRELDVMCSLLTPAVDKFVDRYGVIAQPIMEPWSTVFLNTYPEQVAWFSEWYLNRMEFLYATFVPD